MTVNGKGVPGMRVVSMSLIIIAALGAVSYLNSLNGKFIWDDHYLVKGNTLIKNPSRMPDVFRADIAAGVGRKSRSYRPMQILTYMLDYSLWRLDVRGYHITNILLHILTAFSIYFFISLLYGNRFLSFVTAAIFVVHPVHTEAVAYISGRADSLAGLFIILCLISYVRYTAEDKMPYLILSLLCCALALLSRENSLIIPGLLLVYHYSFNKKINLKGFIGIAGVVLSYMVMRLTILKSLLSSMTSGSSTLFERMPGFFAAVAAYIRILFMPFWLHMEYGERLFSPADPKAIIGIVIIALLSFYLIKKGKPGGVARFSILWFFAALLPSSNFYPVTAYMAEHWLYIPSVGFFLLIASWLNRLYITEKFKLIAVIIVSFVLACCSLLTARQNAHWREPIAFYERTLRYTPGSWRVYNDLGLAYYEEERVDEAIAEYKKALELNPDFVDAYNNLGIAYKAKGKNKEAIAQYAKAISMDEDYAVAYYNIANIYYDMGNYDKAISLYREAIDKNPHHARVYYNLANACRRLGNAREAEAAYKDAIEADPGYAYPYNNLGIIYYETGRKQEAIALYKKALSLDPAYVDAYNNLGMSYYDVGKIKEAISLFKKAIEIDPSHNLAYYNLSILYYYQKDFKQAIHFYDEALKHGHEPNPEFLKVLEPYRER